MPSQESSRYHKQVEHFQQVVGHDPAYHLADAKGRWVCPFCETAISGIDTKASDFTERAAMHLMNASCRAALKGFMVGKTASELAGIVEAIDEHDKTGAPSVQKPPSQQVQIARRQRHRRSMTLDEMLVERRAAAAVQARMFPKSAPQIEGYEAAFMFQPTRDVTGDFFDLYALGPDRMAVGMGDVSGHGMPSGLVMSMARAMIALYARLDAPPREALIRMNVDLLPVMEKEMFVTALAGVLDAREHAFTYARAGHNEPILATPHEWPSELPSGGASLGVMSNERFGAALQPAHVDIPPGGTLLLYTDGLVEAMSPKDEEFGLERLVYAVNAARNAGGAQAFLDGLLETIQSFIQDRGFEDDITMIALHRRSHGGGQ
jgi:serine phosphatase RsbU (regulator of sigma subunit)